MTVRKDDRYASNVPTSARIPASQIDVAIVDVSTTGCRIRTTSQLAQVGATILVKFVGDEEVAGQIVWVDRKQCGVRFNRLLPEEFLDRIAL